MRDGEGNLGHVNPFGIDEGVWTLSLRVASDQGDTAPDSIHARVDFVTERAGVYLPTDWRVLVKRMRSPATTERIVREVFGGGAPDSGPALGVVAGVVSLSRTLERVAVLLADVVRRVFEARTWPDLDEAARLFAAIIHEVGPVAAFRIFTLGKGPVESDVGDALGLGEDIQIVGDDVIREYMSMGGDTKAKDARTRYSKGMKSRVRNNVRNTLEYLDNTGMEPPLEDDDPNRAVNEVLEEFDAENDIAVERLPGGTELISTDFAPCGGWFKVHDAKKPVPPGSELCKVRGRVVALTGKESEGRKDRVLFISKNQLSSLEFFDSKPPPPPMPDPLDKKKPPGAPGKPKVPEAKKPPASTMKKSTGDEAGTKKGAVSNQATGKKPPFGQQSIKVKFEGDKKKKL